MRSQFTIRRHDDRTAVRSERRELVLVAGDVKGLRKQDSKASSFARSLPWPGGGKWGFASRGNTAPVNTHGRQTLAAMPYMASRATAAATMLPQLRLQSPYAGQPARGCSLGTV